MSEYWDRLSQAMPAQPMATVAPTMSSYSLTPGNSALSSMNSWGNQPAGVNSYSLLTTPPQTSFDGVGGAGLAPNPTTAWANLASGNAGSQTGKGWNWFDRKNADGTVDQGRLSPLVGLGSGLFNAWMGMKQYGLAKDQLAEGKKQFALNYDAQRSMTNSQLADRQATRLAGNGGTGYQSVGDYMKQYGVKPLGG